MIAAPEKKPGPLWTSSQVRRAFNRRVAHYQYHSACCLEVAERLFERLDCLTAGLQPQTILDLGCGTGTCLPFLQQRFSSAQLFALDVADQMLLQINPKIAQKIAKIAGDAHQLPLANQSIDLIVSNLMLPWAIQFPMLFRELTRILRPGGCLIFSTLGTDSFKELRHHWPQTLGTNQIYTFPDMHPLGDLLLNCQLIDPVMDRELITIEYESIQHLLHELHVVGGGYLTPTDHKGLRGKNYFKHWEPIFPESPSITLELIYGCARKNQHAQPNTTTTETIIPLTQIRKKPT